MQCSTKERIVLVWALTWKWDLLSLERVLEHAIGSIALFQFRQVGVDLEIREDGRLGLEDLHG